MQAEACTLLQRHAGRTTLDDAHAAAERAPTRPAPTARPLVPLPKQVPLGGGLDQGLEPHFRFNPTAACGLAHQKLMAFAEQKQRDTVRGAPRGRAGALARRRRRARKLGSSGRAGPRSPGPSRERRSGG